MRQVAGPWRGNSDSPRPASPFSHGTVCRNLAHAAGSASPSPRARRPAWDTLSRTTRTPARKGGFNAAGSSPSSMKANGRPVTAACQGRTVAPGLPAFPSVPGSVVATAAPAAPAATAPRREQFRQCRQAVLHHLLLARLQTVQKPFTVGFLGFVRQSRRRRACRAGQQFDHWVRKTGQPRRPGSRLRSNSISGPDQAKSSSLLHRVEKQSGGLHAVRGGRATLSNATWAGRTKSLVNQQVVRHSRVKPDQVRGHDLDEAGVPVLLVRTRLGPLACGRGPSTASTARELRILGGHER